MLEINLPLLSRSLFCHDGAFIVTVVAASVVGVVIAISPIVVVLAATVAVVIALEEVNLPFLSLGLNQD